jgi:hypothetical protein
LKPILVKVAIVVEFEGKKYCQALLFDEWDFTTPEQQATVHFIMEQTVNRMYKEAVQYSGGI